MRAIVSGALANKPRNGGAAWTRLSWLLGLKRLGFDVHFVEEICPLHCVDVHGNAAPFGACLNQTYFTAVMNQLDLEGCGTLLCGEETRGLGMPELLDLAADTDLLVNLSGHLTLAPIKSRIRRTVYVDLDPGFTQLWHAAGLIDLNLEGHRHYFTVGENIGAPSCSLPIGDIAWRTTRQPVVLDCWPMCAAESPAGFSTIASWRGPYGSQQHNGRWLGVKAHELRRFTDLPAKTGQSFELALDIDSTDLKDQQQLQAHGWRIVDPVAAVPDPIAFRRYVQTSSAEFSVAKEVYVHTQSGWFSDRTTRYLASGKPVVVQDTGFSRRYPTGDGLLAFRSKQEAMSAVREVERNYAHHSAAARAIAETYFDSDRVLTQVLEAVL